MNEENKTAAERQHAEFLAAEDGARKAKINQIHADIVKERDREQAIADSIQDTREQHVEGMQRARELGNEELSKLHNKAFRLHAELSQQVIHLDPALKREYEQVSARIVELESEKKAAQESIKPELTYEYDPEYAVHPDEEAELKAWMEYEPTPKTKEGMLTIAEWHKLPNDEKVKRVGEIKRSSRTFL